MTEWRATTKSGKTYTQHRSGVRLSSGEYYHNAQLRNVSREMLMEAEGLGPLMAVPTSLTPEVGTHMFISTTGDSGWRISTEVVSVETLPPAFP